jgi:trk system potassium uptake protein TrkH
MGGMGILILAVAVLPLLGVGGSQLFKAEAAGPVKDTKLTPRMTGTAKGLWGVYACFPRGLRVAYWAGRHGAAGCGDAHVHHREPGRAVAARRRALGIFQSPLAGSHLHGLHAGGQLQLCAVFCGHSQGPLARFLARPGAARHLGTLVGGGPAGGAAAVGQGRVCATDALRHGMFNVVSLATTTGYATVDYLAWPVFAPVFMLLLSGVATSAGSTGCGIKMVRMLILVKQARREMTRLVHPRAVQPVRWAMRWWTTA